MTLHVFKLWPLPRLYLGRGSIPKHMETFWTPKNISWKTDGYPTLAQCWLEDDLSWFANGPILRGHSDIFRGVVLWDDFVLQAGATCCDCAKDILGFKHLELEVCWRLGSRAPTIVPGRTWVVYNGLFLPLPYGLFFEGDPNDLQVLGWSSKYYPGPWINWRQHLFWGEHHAQEEGLLDCTHAYGALKQKIHIIILYICILYLCITILQMYIEYLYICAFPKHVYIIL